MQFTKLFNSILDSTIRHMQEQDKAIAALKAAFRGIEPLTP
jgi:hypothetical protein